MMEPTIIKTFPIQLKIAAATKWAFLAAVRVDKDKRPSMSVVIRWQRCKTSL